MSIKLVAIDLYGTLVGPGGHGSIPPANRKALVEALDRGINIALITGLNRGSALNVLRIAGIDTLPGLMVACFNGAVMFKPATDDVAWEYSLSPQLASEIVGHPDISPHFPMVHGPFDTRNLMWTQKGSYPPIMERYLKRRIETLGSSALRKVDDLTGSITFPVQDISVLAPEENIYAAEEHLGALYSKVAKLIKSRWNEGYAWLEILHAEAGKGEAIRRMRDHLKLKTDDVMAIGDNWNDIEMFEQSGVSVAMGNAPDEVKQRASFVTSSWEQSGVAHAFKSWGLTD